MDARQQAVVDRFAALPSWEERYQELIRLGTGLKPMDQTFRTDEFKLRGCQSQVWLHARLEDGRIRLQAESDALIVKGLVALVLEIYDGRTPAELLELKPEFVDAIGMRTHLSPTRANGLASMLKQIHLYGLAFRMQQESAG